MRFSRLRWCFLNSLAHRIQLAHHLRVWFSRRDWLAMVLLISQEVDQACPQIDSRQKREKSPSLLFYSAVRTSHRLDQIGDHGGKSLPLHSEQCYTTRQHVFAQGRKSRLQSITGQHFYAYLPSLPHQHLPNPSPCHFQAWNQELRDSNLVYR